MCSASVEDLRVDVRLQVRHDPVDVAENAGDVAVDVEDAVRAAVVRELDLREVHRARGGAGVDELGERRRHFAANRSCASLVEPPMWGVRTTFESPGAGSRRPGRSTRAPRENVDRGSGEVAALERAGERVDHDDRAAAGVQEVLPLLHRASSPLADHVFVCGVCGTWSETKSDSARSVARLGTERLLPMGRRVAMSK